jgi:hypothetical protein
MAKPKKKQNFTIKVEGVERVKRGLKNLGLTAKKSRTEINKALRPAANMLSRGWSCYCKKIKATWVVCWSKIKKSKPTLF